MRECLSEIEKRFNKEDSVLVTVVESVGSAPRVAGAHMLVGKEGRLCGTVGGGSVEFQAIGLAEEMLRKKSSTIKKYFLHENKTEDIGMVCGGDVTLFFWFVNANNSTVQEIIKTALSLTIGNDPAWFIMELSEKSDCEIGIFTDKLGMVGSVSTEVADDLCGERCVFERSGKKYYAENIVLAGKVYIFGGGHIAQELVPLLTHLDFRCIVHEYRPEYVTRELFPDAEDLRIVDFEKISDMKKVTASDYIIVMTHGHKYDLMIEEQALKTPARYIGVIGSARKKAAVEASLMEHGFTREDIDRVTMPLGIKRIMAETPAEIAVSIAAQLIAVRAGAGAVS